MSHQYRYGLFGVTGVSRNPLLKLGTKWIGAHKCDYSHVEDILRIARIETLEDANTSHLFLKSFWTTEKNECKQQQFYDAHIDDHYLQLINKIRPDNLQFKQCFLCQDTENKVPAIRQYTCFNTTVHCQCFDKIVEILKNNSNDFIELIRYQLPHWIHSNVSKQINQDRLLQNLIFTVLKRVYYQSVSGDECKEAIDYPPLCIDASPEEQTQKEKELTEKINATGIYFAYIFVNCTLDSLYFMFSVFCDWLLLLFSVFCDSLLLLFSVLVFVIINITVQILFNNGKNNNEEKSLEQQEIHKSIKKSKQIKAGWLNVNFSGLGINAPRTVDWGAFDLDLDRGVDMLPIQFLIECVTHPMYHDGRKDRLTRIKLNGKWIKFDIGYYDDCRKIALIHGFGEKYVNEMVCYLCADPLNPTFGLGTINTVCHAKCFRKIHLPTKRVDILFNALMVQLPEEVIAEADKIPNLLVARNCLVNETIGKAFDEATSRKYVEPRQAIFGKGASNDSLTFDWSILRTVGDSDKDWDKVTSNLGMSMCLLVLLHVVIIYYVVLVFLIGCY